MIHGKYLLRPITKRIPQQRLFGILESTIRYLLPLSQLLARAPAAGRYLKRLVPVADYTGIYPLTNQQLEEWALLDTFDMLAPQYDNPQRPSTIKKWMIVGGFEEIEILQANLLVVRGVKR